MTNIQPRESAMPVRLSSGQERAQEGLVGVVFRTVNMAAGSVHDSRCLPFALAEGTKEEGKRGVVIRTVKSDSISWMALRSETQLLSLFTHTHRGLVAVRSRAMLMA